MEKSAKETDRPDTPDSDFALRFQGVRHLYGETAFCAFMRAHICVVGIGGVGSWAAEALARSGIGNLTLIDPDAVALSNVNRQIQALQDNIGQAKVRVLARRIGQISPGCRVSEVAERVTPENPGALLAGRGFDYVIDAVDDLFAKAALIAWCRENSLSLVTVGGAGGQTDPTKITVCDLCRTEQEPLLARVRKRLRQKYGFPRGIRSFGIDAVYSTEPLRYPDSVGASVSGDAPRFGTSVAVTACFGMTAASVVLQKLALS